MSPTTTDIESTEFKKKKYEKIDPSSLRHSINLSSQHTSEKKIIATNTLQSLREQFKRTFLPLLIDVFELRQTLENAKLKKLGIPFVSSTKSPAEIVQRLTEMKESVLETQRWCDGVITQIAKGIEEATEVAALLNESLPSEEEELSQRT